LSIWRGIRFFAAGVVLFGHVAARANAQPSGHDLQSQPLGPLVQIVGRVVDGDSGQGVAEAVVTLSSVLPRTGSDQPGSRELQARSGAQGLFTFRDVPAGAYNLVAQAPGYIEGAFGQANASASTSLVLEGMSNSPIVLRLWKSSAIVGIVTDSAGRPLANVNVRALRWENVAGRRRVVGRGGAKTNEGGRYNIEGLLRGDYIVWVPSVQASARTIEAMQKLSTTPDLMGLFNSLAPSKPVILPGMYFQNLGVPEARVDSAGRPEIYRSTFWPEGHSPSDAVTIAVTGEQRSSIDFSLERLPAVRVSGRLLDEAGGASGIAVSLLPTTASDFGVESASVTAVGITDADGDFTLLGVPGSTYTLRVLTVPRMFAGLTPGSRVQFTASDDGGLTTVVSPGRAAVPLPLPAGAVKWATLPISIDGSDMTNIDLPLRPGLRLSGGVYFDGDASLAAVASPDQLVLNIESANGATIGSIGAGRGFEVRTFRLTGRDRTACVDRP
jgi:hypothetical protein